MRDLTRFLKANENDYETALNEIKNGRKQSHWMWYIFPQIKGLGHSFTAQYYAIQNAEEAKEYMAHPVLSADLLKISNELLKLNNENILDVFDYPDNLKLKSSMTLFFLVSENQTFKKVLDKFFDGELDSLTVEALRKEGENE